MAVRVVQLGRGIIHCEVDSGATLGEVLLSQGIPVEGMEVRRNSEPTGLDDTLRDGDLITVVPRIKGGFSSRPAHSVLGRFTPAGGWVPTVAGAYAGLR